MSFKAAPLFVLGLISILNACDAGLCGDAITKDVASPDGTHHFVLFVRDCGATSDFSTQLSILPSASKLSGRGNVFVADADHGKAPATKTGGPIVDARWIDAHTLEVRYDARDRIFQKEARRNGVDVHYIVGNP